jgi:predicted ATPase
LFVERARQQGSHLNIEAQYPHIVHICQLVEGMPLALELAAGWVNALSCAEIAAELEQSLTLLKSRSRDMPNRHSSMETVFAHSWHLLTDEERAVLQGCSVFRGGCTRDAAEQVTGAPLSVLASLAEKSLLRHDSDSGRFDLHELLRQYASDKLDQTPEIKETLLDRHAAYYTEFLYHQEKTIHLSNQAMVLKELDNLRIAWKRAVQQRKLALLQRAAPSLQWLYHFQARFDEGAAMFHLAEEAVRAMPVTDDSRFLLGMMQLFQGFYRLRQFEQDGTSSHSRLAEAAGGPQPSGAGDGNCAKEPCLRQTLQ